MAQGKQNGDGMKELFKISKIFLATKKACLQKKVDELEAYIMERYSLLKKTTGREFVFEAVRLNASIAAYLTRVQLRGGIPKIRWMDFLLRKVDPKKEQKIFGRVGEELKALGVSMTSDQFLKFLMNVDKTCGLKKRRIGSKIIKFRRRPKPGGRPL